MRRPSAVLLALAPTVALAVALAVTLAVAFPTVAAAQTPWTENTLRLAEGAKSPPAKISDIAWLAGHWTGEALGGLCEEIWSPPRDGGMMGMFRLLKDGKPSFYELLTLVERDGTLILRLKHFSADFVGWEEKDETVDFPLVKVQDGEVAFEGMTFKRVDADTVKVFLVIGHKGSDAREALFVYQRVKE